jgi:hypothetical protein
MDLTLAAMAVAKLLASGASKELGAEAGGGLVTGIIQRVRAVFGSDARSADALEHAQQNSSAAAIQELSSALAWYAQRDQAFAADLMRWAAQAPQARVTQEVHAGRDAYVAGRDQTIFKRPEE